VKLPNARTGVSFGARSGFTVVRVPIFQMVAGKAFIMRRYRFGGSSGGRGTLGGQVLKGFGRAPAGKARVRLS